MVLRFSNRHMLIWEWPTGPMLWFFWEWKPQVMDGAIGYRIGPLSYWIYP